MLLHRLGSAITGKVTLEVECRRVFIGWSQMRLAGVCPVGSATPILRELNGRSGTAAQLCRALHTQRASPRAKRAGLSVALTVGMTFFDPNTRTSPLFEMGGAGHVALVLLMLGLLGAVITWRQPLRHSALFMKGTSALVLLLEVVSSVSTFFFPFDHAFERIPLHLCASLKIAVAIGVLFERYDLVKFISTWAIGAGFISFVNLNLEGAGFGNFECWHYLIGHYYLFLMPTLLFLAGDFRYDLKFQVRSMAGLGVWSLLIFFVNWKFDTNYMYSGPHNQTAVPFIPPGFMVWPLNYVSYVGVGLILISAIYLVLKLFQTRMEQAVC
jgi:hypothetical integral membrane protein (TIGR02206 family)